MENTVQDVNKFAQYFSDHLSDYIGFACKVVLALAAFFVGRILIRWVRKIVRKALEKSAVDTGVSQFLDSLLKFGLYFLLLFCIATKFGVDTASVAALIASCGVAVGLALQGSLSNFAGGVLILILKPFAVGDYIIEDTNKKEGVVTEIQIFYTKLTTLDNKTVVIPNGILTNNSLTNVSAMKERLLDLRINITYESDLKIAKETVLSILTKNPLVKKDKDINVFVDELSDSAVVLGFRAWVDAVDYFPAKWELLEEVKLSFDANQIEMAYPQIVVHDHS